MSQTLADLVLAAAKHNNSAASSAQIATRSAKYVEQVVNDATAEVLSKIEADVRALVEPVVQSLLTGIEEDVAAKQDKLTAGDNITIAEDGTISATVPDITVDSALSSTSANPVQNKVIKTVLDAKQDKLIAGENITIAEDGKTISASGGSGSTNTEVWNGTIDSIDGVTDDMIGAKALSNGNYPRLHARNKEIHGCTGFSNETGDYTGQEFLLDWSVAKTNGTSFLSSHTIWNSDRGFGADVTFAQPLMPAATGAYKPSPYAIPCFENSPVYWSGHFMYNDEPDADGVYRAPIKQVRIPWDSMDSGATESIAFVSQLAALEQRIVALENA